ncbi:protein adenylyltransferase SelO [Zavarzinia aquatilis]|uniref:Protein nucleotidyltransferase YdiU n=1 Tax=Zavarzinia aquatilis TaxID=2211142 RepID=A0A317EF72_9PROT|nr:YdiU family protein [Zavarzinia aquatilis]PWR24944.1 YdiU family protein [Zavarzinia aquatilis]
MTDTAEADPGFRFDNSYARLPERFHAFLAPTPVAAPGLIRVNRDLCADLGLDADALAASPDILAGNRVPAGAQPLAEAYAGHQFGNFVPQLGDGRAILLGEVIDREGRRRDIQLKGSGPTPFSRSGDGRAALGPVLREYIVSEAMHALGIPTTRALGAVTTGDYVRRDRVLPGAVLTRVAASHIRVGTFQYFAVRGDTEALRLLADHVIARHYPDLAGAENTALALLVRVAERQASLVARWMHVGFVHGVMNTDNVTVSGETIDFGPCAFMEAFDVNTVFSSIDERGRYAFGNQGGIANWNIARFAETLLPLIDEDEARAIAAATEVVQGFAIRFRDHWLSGMRAKLGLATAEDGDLALIQALLGAMQQNGADYTLTFRHLAGLLDGRAVPRDLFIDPTAFDAWAEGWHARLAREDTPADATAAAMRATNPVFIPRNHRVEQAIAAAEQRGDFAPFHRLVAILARPFDEQPDAAEYAEPAPPGEEVRRTFCGT